MGYFTYAVMGGPTDAPDAERMGRIPDGLADADDITALEEQPRDG